MTKLNELPEYQALKQHQQEIAGQHMRDWFAKDHSRFKQFSIQLHHLLFDYSRHRITDKTLALLIDLANARQVKEKIQALFAGEIINTTEKRPALHMALRDPHHSSIMVKGQDIAKPISTMQAKMRAMVDKLHNKQWLGATGKPIKHIVNIGIGGSYLGPMMGVQALSDFATKDLSCHFISTVDTSHLQDVLSQIDTEATLFIISSKSFTTIETLTNANSIIDSMTTLWGDEVLTKQFIAVTAAPQKARDLGIADEHILELWDWVGGRYSVWSAIGLPLAFMLGNQQFQEFLQGAYDIDQHVKEAEFSQNVPVIMALLSIWYSNFFDASAKAIIPYANRLGAVINYLQQLEMESNGKSSLLSGEMADYATCPIIFGQEGINGQHAYHQFLHQGHAIVPADFILVGLNLHNQIDEHQQVLLASGLSQAAALMRGRSYEQAKAELLAAGVSETEANTLAHHKVIQGNKPSSVLFLDKITPRNLGALIAIYEHSVFIQAVIRDINAFDQYGVELGKDLLPDILQQLQDGVENIQIDCSTAALIKRLKQLER